MTSFGLCLLILNIGRSLAGQPPVAGPHAPLALVAVIFLIVAVIPVLLTLALRSSFYVRGLASLRARNRDDYRRSVAYRDYVQRFLSTPAEMFDTRLDSTYPELRLVEVSRHFDQSLAGIFSATASPAMGSDGGPGFFLGGQITATIRANLLADAMMAVFETPGGEVIRLVAPSTARTREVFEERLAWLAGRFEPGSHLDVAIRDSASWITNAITTHVSHVSDRLYAIARLPPDARPRVWVSGRQIADHVILGTAIGFQDDPTSYLLFPTLGLEAISEAALRP
jgi:hypothetical protein